LGTNLFLPIYIVARLCMAPRSHRLNCELRESIQSFKDKGYSPGKFLGYCTLFGLVAFVTNYLYVLSLNWLTCTDVLSLFACNVAFVYLLSWVVLHHQFVGIRIVAVILTNTGIALLAYMDGIKGSTTLGGVVLAAASAAASAVYKVAYKRLMGRGGGSALNGTSSDPVHGGGGLGAGSDNPTNCQVAISFSVISFCGNLVLWPIIPLLHFTNVEPIHLSLLPWPSLGAAVALALCGNLLANFGGGSRGGNETFVTLSLVVSIPVSAALDSMWYNHSFHGMRLAGMVMISCGFLMVLIPENMSDIIKSFIARTGRRNMKEQLRYNKMHPPDLRTGHIGSRLRSPSGRVRVTGLQKDFKNSFCTNTYYSNSDVKMEKL